MRNVLCRVGAVSLFFLRVVAIFLFVLLIFGIVVVGVIGITCLWLLFPYVTIPIVVFVLLAVITTLLARENWDQILDLERKCHRYWDKK